MKSAIKILFSFIICFSFAGNTLAVNNNLLVVNDDYNNYAVDSFKTVLDSLGVTYDEADAYYNYIESSDIREYKYIIWVCGINGYISSYNESVVVKSFLNSGGRFLLTAGYYANNTDYSLMEDYFKCQYYTRSTSDYTIEGSDNCDVSEGIEFTLNTNYYVSYITLKSDGSKLFYDKDYPDRILGCYYDGDYKSMFIGIERMTDISSSSTRETILSRILEWFDTTIDISGYITNVYGTNASGITVIIQGSKNSSTETDNNGYYKYSMLPAGNTYTICPQPSDSYYKFNPPYRIYTDTAEGGTFQDYSSVRINSFNIELRKNLFNPSNGETFKLLLDIPTTDSIEVVIYNINMEPVKTLLKRSEKNGSVVLFWNGKNDSDEPVASGLYIVFIRGYTSGASEKRKVILVK